MIRSGHVKVVERMLVRYKRVMFCRVVVRETIVRFRVMHGRGRRDGQHEKKTC